MANSNQPSVNRRLTRSQCHNSNTRSQPGRNAESSTTNFDSVSVSNSDSDSETATLSHCRVAATVFIIIVIIIVIWRLPTANWQLP